MGDYVNSRQVRFDKSFVSCGVLECHHLPEASPSQTFFSILNNLYHKANPRPAAYVIFSDVVAPSGTKSRGQQLAQHISDLAGKLGFLHSCFPKINPKTGNVIQLWVWTIDHDAARSLYKDELAERIDAD